MTYKFPDSDLQVGFTLASLLGGFWSSLYGGRDLVQAYAAGRGLLEQRTFQSLKELSSCTSRSSIPVHHRELWTPLVIKQSERKPAPVINFGDGSVFGNQPVTGVVYQYGFPADPSIGYLAPSKLARVPLICSSMRSPSVVWTDGVDFVFHASSSKLLFRDDPFLEPLLTPQPVFDNVGNIDDYELTIWLWQAEFDWKYLYSHFGSVVGLNMPSSDAYKSLINTLIDSLVSGPSHELLARAVSALTASPIAQEDGEVVEAVFTDPDTLWIVTDKHAYPCGVNAVPIVSVGDSLVKDDPLTDAFQIDNFNAGVAPAHLSAVALGRGLLIGNFIGEIAFGSNVVPVQVTTDPQGVTKVTWELGGFPSDVEQFWNTVHTRGVAAGRTLAQYMDQRTNQVGQPVASNLPATINPLKFLVENLLRNCVLVTVRQGSFGPNAPGISNPAVIRRLVPPQYAILYLVDMTPIAGTANTVLDGGLELIGLYTGMFPLTDGSAPADASSPEYLTIGTV